MTEGNRPAASLWVLHRCTGGTTKWAWLCPVPGCPHQMSTFSMTRAEAERQGAEHVEAEHR